MIFCFATLFHVAHSLSSGISIAQWWKQKHPLMGGESDYNEWFVGSIAVLLVGVLVSYWTTQECVSLAAQQYKLLMLLWVIIYYIVQRWWVLRWSIFSSYTSKLCWIFGIFYPGGLKGTVNNSGYEGIRHWGRKLARILIDDGERWKFSPALVFNYGR